MIVSSTLTTYGRGYLKVMCTMCTMGRAAALTLTLAAFTSLVLVLVPSAAAAQDRPCGSRGGVGPVGFDQAQDEAQDEGRRREVQTLMDVIRAALRGQVATERSFEWENDFLKGVEGKTYVPFTLVIDPVKVTSPTMAVYVLVTEHAPTDQPAAPDTDDRQSQADADQSQADADQSEDVSIAFEDAYFIDVDPSESVAHRLRRAFAVPGGEYDLYVAVKETSSSEDTEAPATVMMLKQGLTVPDLWGSELATSTVIMAQQVEPLAAPLSPEEQIANPYTIGAMRIVPAADSIFAGSDSLSLMFLVYNSRLNADNKPDVTVEYNFHRRTSAGEEFFNKTNPQHFNAETLPASFDGSAGHQLVAGQALPLSSFPEGDYRLEITVKDNASGASVIRDVTFTVGGP